MKNKPKNLKAAILFETNKPLKLLELDLPELKRGQVLVKIKYSGICRSQLMEQSGLRGKDIWLPHLLGHEGSGIVVDVGPGVTKVKKNNKVVLSWIKSKGLESNEICFSYKGLKINAGKVTTFSNYSIISENRISIMPQNLTYKIAALLGCAMSTGAGLILNQVKPKKNDVVIIIGFGGIGISAYLALKFMKIKNIIIIDSDQKKLALAKKLGVKNVFSSKNNNISTEVLKITKGGAKYCIESAGLKESIELGFSLINKFNGELHFASHPKNGDKISINPYELIQGKKIFGTWGGKTNPDYDLKKFSKVINSGFKLNLLFNKVYKLENINQAFNDLKFNRTLRPLIKMEH